MQKRKCLNYQKKLRMKRKIQKNCEIESLSLPFSGDTADDSFDTKEVTSNEEYVSFFDSQSTNNNDYTNENDDNNNNNNNNTDIVNHSNDDDSDEDYNPHDDGDDNNSVNVDDDHQDFDVETTTTGTRTNKSILNYFKLIKEGPTVVCTCCGILIFPRHAKFLRKHLLEQRFVKRNQSKLSANDLYARAHMVPDSSALCSTCYKSILGLKLPVVSITINYKLDDSPCEAIRTLNVLEERLISPRIPFMQIRNLGCDRSKYLKGYVLNVPTDVGKMCSVLPRTFDEAEVVQINLKRSNRQTGSYISETVCPAKIKAALQYLSEQPLYKLNNIVVDWAKLPATIGGTVETDQLVPFIVTSPSSMANATAAVAVPEIVDVVPHTQNTNHDGNVIANDRSNNDGCEIDDEAVVIANDENDDDTTEDVQTMLQKNDGPICFAPGQNQKPLSFIRDHHVEELTFPSIYHGKARNHVDPTVIADGISSAADTVNDGGRHRRKIFYGQVIRHEVMFFKRYCATRADKLFFSFFLKQTLDIFSGISLHIRQTTTTASSVNANSLSTANNITSNAAAPANSLFQINPTNINVNIQQQQQQKSDTLTAGDLLNSKSVAQLIGADKAFSFTKNMTMSPAFWADERKNSSP
ncbi:unnamed protein product [Psylliodes chrysocephalus]|uniref:DUF6570 domain-containing protein n=1 Tax=Psylliodes chrysocephalus TaxID=3402493 RepID=A0A9P0CMN5_9CUCU|nr:unnamed protein product [Psylliodes chrysocephala]